MASFSNQNNEDLESLYEETKHEEELNPLRKFSEVSVSTCRNFKALISNLFIYQVIL